MHGEELFTIRDESVLNPENTVMLEVKAEKYDHVDFYPAKHPVSPEEWAVFQEAVKKNWLTTSVWNEELGNKLKDKEYQVLAIDGAGAIERDLQTGDHLSSWKLLPLQPNELNQSGEVTMLGSDIFGTTPYIDYSYEHGIEFSQALYNATEKYNQNARDAETKRRLALTVVGIVAATTGMAVVAKGVAESRNDNGGVMSRRAFLKLGGGAAAAYGVTRITKGMGQGIAQSLHNDAGYSLTAQGQDMYLSIIDMLEDKNIYNSIVDGRTAALIQKAKEYMAIEERPEDEAVGLVMGFSHSHVVSEFLENKDAREEAIRNYIKALNGIVESVGSRMSVDTSQIITNLNRRYTEIRPIHIRQPDVDPSNPDATKLQDCISYPPPYSSPMISRIVNELSPIS